MCMEGFTYIHFTTYGTLPLPRPAPPLPHPCPFHYDRMGMSFWRLVAYVSPPSSQDQAPGLGLGVVGERGYVYIS